LLPRIQNNTYRTGKIRVADYAGSEGQNDGSRHLDGRISATERDTELLPEHHIQRRGHQRGRRLFAVRTGSPGTRPLSQEMEKKMFNDKFC